MRKSSRLPIFSTNIAGGKQAPAPGRTEPQPFQPVDICRPVEVDGEIIRVHGGAEMDADTRAMFAEVVLAAKRRLAAEGGA
jgi:hypothetical protein